MPTRPQPTTTAEQARAATCYPTGIAAVPIEILEASMPIEFQMKELRHGSGGSGRMRGGDGQVIKFRMRTESPWLLNAVTSRTTVRCIPTVTRCCS